MKKYLLVLLLLTLLSGCAVGVYDHRYGFSGAVIGAPYGFEPYHSYDYYRGYPYGHGYRGGYYYRAPGYPGYWR